MPLVAGTPIGSYVVVSPLGAGGMGEVYRAHDPRLGRDVALKVIRRALFDEGDGQGDALDRLLREASLASGLNHPNIVTIYETGVVGEDRYVAMELVEGVTLRQFAAGGIPLERAVSIVRQVAEALAVAHAAQIVHRDIKPENVMVRPDGYVKLLDFGLAKMQGRNVSSGATQRDTDPGMLVGTVGYMAPEQARGEAAAPEADVFAFGVLAYELVTGRHPFIAPSQVQTLQALMWETPEPPSLVNPDLPRPLDQLILEMLNKDPRLRPGAGEVLYRLAMAHDASVAVALSAVSVGQRDARTSRSVVGRDLELDALLHEFESAQRGHGRMVVVSGEAGVGKTTLVEAFVKQLEDRGEAFRLGRGRCSERLAGSEAYLPVLEVLDTLQHNEQLGSLSRLIRAFAPSWYTQITPTNARDSSAARLAAETAGGSQERLKREMAALLQEIARMHPVVLWLDDVHWADPSTTDLLGYLSRRIDETRLMIVITCRPSELAQSRHAFLALKHDLVSRGLCRELTPGHLDEDAIAAYLALQYQDHTFPRTFAVVLHERTEGHPLFVVDLLRDLHHRQVLRQQDGRWILSDDLAAVERELPESMRSLVQRKIDALDDDDRKLLGAASVQGVDFDTALVAGVLDRSEEDTEDRLERLEREHALVRFIGEWEAPDRQLTLRYQFAHHIYHNAFYDAQRATRRAALARAVAERLVRRIGPGSDDSSADIALLFETSRDNLRAAEYWNRAAQAAARLYSHADTERLAQRGLALLESEPAGPQRSAVELDLQMTYGLSMKTSRGYAVPEVGQAYARARELCREVADPGRVVPVLVVLSAHHVVSGEIETSRDVALEMVDLFNQIGDPNLQMVGQWSLGAALFHLGELEVAHDHLTRALELYDPAYHSPRVWETGIDPGVFCSCELSRTWTLRGYPDQGLHAVREAVARARALAHPQPLTFALLFQTLIHLARREPAEVLSTFDELAKVCRAHGIAQELQWGVPLRGRALVEMGDVKRGLDEIAQGLEAHTFTRSTLLRPYYFTVYAGALLRAGDPETAQRALDEARGVAIATGQRAYESEHRRLQAEVMMARGETSQVEEIYGEALALARAQGAKWLELRAARGCASFLIRDGRPDEARRLLAPVAEWFTEGRTSLDWVYADALLRTLDRA